MSLILEVDTVEDTESVVKIETFCSVGATSGIEETKVIVCRKSAPYIDFTDDLHIKEEIKTEPQDDQDEIRIRHINKEPRSCMSLGGASVLKQDVWQLSGVYCHDDGIIGDHHAMEGLKEAYIELLPLSNPSINVDVNDGWHIKEEIKTADEQDDIYIHHINKEPRSCMSLEGASMLKEEAGQLSCVSCHDGCVIGDHHAMAGAIKEDIEVMHVPELSIHKDMNDRQHHAELVTDKPGVLAGDHRNLQPPYESHGDGKLQQCTIIARSIHEQSVRIHMAACTGEKTHACPESSTCFAYNHHHSRHSKTHTAERPLRCPECPASFAKSTSLSVHTKTHTGEKPYTCPECPVRFTNRSSLLRHTRTHIGEKPYTCPDCLAAFALKHHLSDHMKTHTGEKPYTCPDCAARFTRKSSLRTHIRTYTGENPFKCSECPAAFSRKNDLTVHIRIHTGEKPFKCSECPAAFCRKFDLNVHIRIHTGERPFKCTECPSAFARKDHLANHIRVHTGERPFKCPNCSTAFSRKHHLSDHIRTHTGEKPVTCRDCATRFTSKGNISRHIMIHTGENPYKCPCPNIQQCLPKK